VIIDHLEHKRVMQARTHLVINHPFFGALALRLKLDQAPIGTMDVDGKTIRYDPAFTKTLTFDRLVGVMAHEVMHCAAGHHARRGGRDPGEWNVAGDMAINPLLIMAGLTLPEGALLDPTMVDDRGLPLGAEVIYTRRKQQRPQLPPEPQEEEEDEEPEDEGGDEEQPHAPGQGADDGEGQGEQDGGEEDQQQQGQGSGAEGPGEGQGDAEKPGNFGGCGSFRDAPVEDGDDSKAAQAEQAREWEIATMQAVAAAKGAGSLPAAGEWLVGEIQAPKIDWREILRDFVQVRARSDATWSRPNRRHLHRGMYLPSRDDKELGELVVITDASGSTWGPLQDVFATELNGIVEDARPRTTHVVYWDTQCQGHEEFEPDDLPLTLTARGGGGTVFEGIWDWIEEHEIDPACVVVLTDLDLTRFGAEPPYPVLWASTLKTFAPFGEVVQLTL